MRFQRAINEGRGLSRTPLNGRSKSPICRFLE